MTFSIVIPSLNQGRYIGDAVESVLGQSGIDVEILVVDGGSSDETLSVLRGFGDRISWRSGVDRGQTDAINQGLKEGRGSIMAYLNSDDVLFPGSLRVAEEHFLKNPACRILYGNAHHLHEDGTFMESYYNEPWNYQRLLEVCYICQPATFWRRELHHNYGYFDESLHYAMDYEFWLRVGRKEPFDYVTGAPLAGSRLHGSAKTIAARIPVHREILQVVRRYTTKPYRWLSVLAKLLEQEELGSESAAGSSIIYFQNLFALGRDYEIEFDDAFVRQVTLEMAKKFLPRDAPLPFWKPFR